MVWGRILALLGLGILAGGMLFFGAVMAPLVFTRLPLPVAGVFIRGAFPWYFWFQAIFAALALLGFWGLRLWWGVVPGFVVVASLWSAYWLLPVMDALKAAGNEPGFMLWHNVSTWMNGAELLAVLLVFIRVAARPERI